MVDAFNLKCGGGAQDDYLTFHQHVAIKNLYIFFITRVIHVIGLV